MYNMLNNVTFDNTTRRVQVIVERVIGFKQKFAYIGI